MAVTRNTSPAWLAEATGGAAGALGPDGAAVAERIERQLGFLLALDEAKQVLRRTYLTDGSRLENDGEHMWHAVVAALVLAEHAAEPVDVARLALMLAIHDVVEIDAGDTFVYDEAAQVDKRAREEAAADRLFGMLPGDQGAIFREAWEEFEARATPTAKMAAALDRLLPLLMNRAAGGRTWREHDVRAARVLSLNSSIGAGSPALWEVARRVLEGAVRDGVLAEDPPV